MSYRDAFNELRDAFLQLIALPDIKYTVIWELFILHPCYRHELHLIAGKLHRVHRTYSTDEIEQEAMHQLGEDLKRRRDLKVNRAKAKDSFPAWIRRISSRHCKKAVVMWERQLPSKRTESLLDCPLLASEPPPNEFLKSDVLSHVSMLDALTRKLIELELDGISKREIAARFKLSYDKVCRVIRRGRARLRRLFEADNRCESEPGADRD